MKRGGKEEARTLEVRGAVLRAGTGQDRTGREEEAWGVGRGARSVGRGVWGAECGARSVGRGDAEQSEAQGNRAERMKRWRRGQGLQSGCPI